MEEANRLSGAILSTDLSITLKYPLGSVARNTIIAIDLEEIRVWETSGQVATVVERGVNGTVAAAHADLAVVSVRPKFSNFRILKEINNDLKDLSSPSNGLYQIQTVTLTYNAAIRGYDLAGVANTFLGILEVRYDTPGPDKGWPHLTEYVLMRNMPVSAFASGNALLLNEPAFPGRSIQVRYKGVFSPFTSLTDDITAVAGLTDSMADLPPMGAAIRLVAPREVKRTFIETQGEPRRSEEVQAGSITNATRSLMQLRQSRINDEAARLVMLYAYVL
jgi:hypothetical protein